MQNQLEIFDFGQKLSLDGCYGDFGDTLLQRPVIPRPRLYRLFELVTETAEDRRLIAPQIAQVLALIRFDAAQRLLQLAAERLVYEAGGADAPLLRPEERRVGKA